MLAGETKLFLRPEQEKDKTNFIDKEVSYAQQLAVMYGHWIFMVRISMNIIETYANAPPYVFVCGHSIRNE